MAKLVQVAIHAFDGQDYRSWKKCILVYLELKQCEEVIVRVKRETDNQEEWGQKDLSTKNYIYSAITNKQLVFISNKEIVYIIKNLMNYIQKNVQHK